MKEPNKLRKPRILRKRFIPDEIKDISEDQLLFRNDELLVTRWKPIKPRTDFYAGVSCVLLKEGFKISRFFDKEGRFLYWYCDIIDVEYDKEHDTYILADLLADVKILPDGEVRVLDLGEIAYATEKGLITFRQCMYALHTIDRLLTIIYEGKFPPDNSKEWFDGEYYNA